MQDGIQPKTKKAQLIYFYFVSWLYFSITNPSDTALRITAIEDMSNAALLAWVPSFVTESQAAITAQPTNIKIINGYPLTMYAYTF